MSASTTAPIAIACPACGTRYKLSADALGPAGRKVSCAQCGTTWTARRGPEAAPASRMSEGATRLSEAEENRLDDRFSDLDQHVKKPRKRQLGGLDLNAIGIADGTGERRRLSRFGASRARVEAQGPGARMILHFRLLSVGSLALLLAFGLFFRTDLVRAAPELAALYGAVGLGVNIVGLDITDVTADLGRRGSSSVLTVSARIGNVSLAPVSVPDLVVSLLDKDGALVYAWSVGPATAQLGPGEKSRVVAELSNPPLKAERILLNFAGTVIPGPATSSRPEKDLPSAFTKEQPTPLDTGDGASPAVAPESAAEHAHE